MFWSMWFCGLPPFFSLWDSFQLAWCNLFQPDLILVSALLINLRQSLLLESSSSSSSVSSSSSSLSTFSLSLDSYPFLSLWNFIEEDELTCGMMDTIADRGASLLRRCAWVHLWLCSICSKKQSGKVPYQKPWTSLITVVRVKIIQFIQEFHFVCLYRLARLDWIGILWQCEAQICAQQVLISPFIFTSEVYMPTSKSPYNILPRSLSSKLSIYLLIFESSLLKAFPFPHLFHKPF